MALSPGSTRDGRKCTVNEHELASSVHVMAGLGDKGNQLPVTPEQLIERFCGREAAGLRANYGTKTQDGIITGRGFCGLLGGHGDRLKTGFEDGYDFLGYLDERGWSALPGKGNWPYVVYMQWLHGEKPAIAEYCECDLTVWIFSTRELAKQHYAGLRNCP